MLLLFPGKGRISCVASLVDQRLQRRKMAGLMGIESGDAHGFGKGRPCGFGPADHGIERVRAPWFPRDDDIEDRLRDLQVCGGKWHLSVSYRPTALGLDYKINPKSLHAALPGTGQIERGPEKWPRSFSGTGAKLRPPQKEEGDLEGRDQNIHRDSAN